MKYLLNIEWLKYKNYRPFWWLVGLYLASLFIVNYIVFEVNSYIQNESSPEVEMIFGKSVMAFPFVWETVSFSSSFLLSILGILVILVTTNEFTFKTHRQNIIDGLSREQFITSKIISAFILSVLSTVIVALVAIIMGLIEDYSSFTLERSYTVLYFFIQTLSYTMLALLVSTLFRRGAIAIGIYLLYLWMAEHLLMLWLFKIKAPFAKWLPVQSAEDLLSFPSLSNIKKMAPDFGQWETIFAIPLIYIAIMVFITYKRFVKSDL